MVTIGEVPADVVCRMTEGIWERAWPAQLNRLIWAGGHDLVLSIGIFTIHWLARVIVKLRVRRVS